MSQEPSASRTEPIEVPAPTPWPLVAAFGLSLTFAGLVTSAIVSVVGVVLALAGAAGWWREVLPREQVQHIPLPPPAERARPVPRATHAVDHLQIGVAGHRTRIPIEIHPYSAGISGGLAGGVAMAVLAELYGLVEYGSLWYPINLLAAAAVPSLATANTQQLATFSGLGLAVASLAHVVISIFVGLLYAVILPMLPRHFVWGGVLAPLLWSGALWATLGLINPTLNQRIDWVWFIASQVAFGLTAGIVVARTQRVRTAQTFAPDAGASEGREP